MTRNQVFDHIALTATKEELLLAEKAERVLQSVPVKTLCAFMITHPELEDKAEAAYDVMKRLFPEDSDTEILIYCAAYLYAQYN